MAHNYAALHERLEETAQTLRVQLDDLKNKVWDENVGYSNHMADVGTEVFEQARDVGIKRQLQVSYQNVMRALEKFEDGTYGICESCGDIIEMSRLEALPEARYCIECKSRQEVQQR